MSIQKTTGGKVFTEKEVKKYMLEYGVEINQTKDSISFNGREKDIDNLDYRADYNRAVKESTPVRKDYSDKHYCL